MARNHLSIKNPRIVSLTIDELTSWFVTNGFNLLDFEDGSFEMVSTYGGTPIYHNLKENKGYKTYASESFGGSLLVFEVNLKVDKIDIQCYAPMQLFGFIRLEKSFTEKASFLTKYKKVGYSYMIEFKNFIENKLK